jgi:hypothetical protein
LERNIVFGVELPHHDQGVLIMRSKLALSALVVASLFGATAMLQPQTQPAPGASSEGNVGPGATHSKEVRRHYRERGLG